MDIHFTERQGQYLAFIYQYTKLNQIAPAEADIQKYLKVTPPTVHQMIMKLEKLGLIEKKPRTARSIRLLVPPDKIPNLV